MLVQYNTGRYEIKMNSYTPKMITVRVPIIINPYCLAQIDPVASLISMGCTSVTVRNIL